MNGRDLSAERIFIAVGTCPQIPDIQGLEGTPFMTYIIRNPFSIDKMHPDPETGTIIYRSGMNPKIGRNFEIFTPFDFIAAISQHIPGKSFQLVRGEVYLSFAAFSALNARRLDAGQDPLKSPRNTAAGTLRMLDLEDVARRGLSCRIFAMVESNTEPETHVSELATLATWGIPVIQSRAVPASDVLQTLRLLNLERAELPLPTDGLVITLNDRAAFAQMGATDQWPIGALARKYRTVPVETRLLGVEWMRGESGRLTPVARFEPVEVDGATLERASLHNSDHLKALDLMIGDRIQVIRAGGVIPEIVGRCPGPRSGNESPIPMPPDERPYAGGR